jgi:hypothetical protein
MDFVGIKGRSPEFHTVFSLEVWPVLSRLPAFFVKEIFAKRWTTIQYW